MAYHNYHPRGFTILLDQQAARHNHHETGGMDEVNSLYKEFVSGSLDVTSFEFITKVLKVAKKCFPRGLGFFLTESYAQGGLSDHHRAMLKDTESFILGNPRRMSVLSWVPILAVDDKDAWSYAYSSSSSPVVTNAIKPDGSMYHTDVLAHWISRDKGVEDIVCTLYVLFGK